MIAIHDRSGGRTGLALRVGAGVAVVLLAIAGVLFAQGPAGAEVSIRNVGSIPITTITVAVNGHEETVGPLGVGDEVSVFMRPVGESDLRLTSRVGTQDPVVSEVDTYMEGGGRYPGFEVEIHESGVRTVMHDGHRESVRRRRAE